MVALMMRRFGIGGQRWANQLIFGIPIVGTFAEESTYHVGANVAKPFLDPSDILSPTFCRPLANAFSQNGRKRPLGTPPPQAPTFPDAASVSREIPRELDAHPGNCPRNAPAAHPRSREIPRRIPGKRITRETPTWNPRGRISRERRSPGNPPVNFPPGCPAGLSRGMHICNPVGFSGKHISRAIARRLDVSHRTGERRVPGALFR